MVREPLLPRQRVERFQSPGGGTDVV